ncbi:DUF5908 family protein [Lutibacter citreus]|uniref:DUF5908 family protein n=1 Tax=Lutibacter citreus TaxID=2138210 RepID=UPI0013003B8A|nr:DUF5908 family protein [Lutibacter citreus]
MPIEIKELHIKIQVNDSQKQQYKTTANSVNNIKELKAEIIKTCTRNILEILKEKQER